MDYLTARKFSFIVRSLPEDTFGVINFRGSEGLSRCYFFDVTLISSNGEIDLPAMAMQTATLTCHREDGEDMNFHGIMINFQQLQKIDKFFVYRTCIVPRLFLLSLTRHQQVFLDRKVPDVIDACIKDGGAGKVICEFHLQNSYTPHEYICQYDESHLDFISRWCEREGIYYYFEQTPQEDKVIFADTSIAHTPQPHGKEIHYSPLSGLEMTHEREVIRTFNCTSNIMPASVLIKDYNYEKPSLDVSGNADVDNKGYGQVYYYGEHVNTPEEGTHLAKIRAESLLCRRDIFKGEGFVPYMSSGFTFDLQDHYRKSFNQTYLVTEMTHEGNQTAYLIAGLSALQKNGEDRAFYRNSFSAIPAKVQYRLERKTQWPKISGTIVAHIDAEGSGKYAELDNHGRYKVSLPFDLSGRKGGKASTWIRMAQPYAGSNHGMHFPLHKGTEVLLTFIGGDPDRPVIAAAIPNIENPSVVASANAAQSGFTTAGNNSIYMDDTEGGQHMVLRSGDGSNTFLLGGSDQTSGVSASSQWWYSLAQQGFTSVCMGLQDIMSTFRVRTVTGWLKMQSAFMILNKELIQRGLPLAAKISGQKKDQETGGDVPPPVEPSKAKWDAGSIIGLAAPIVAVALELGLKKAQKNVLQKAIKNKEELSASAELMEILNLARYQVVCIDQGTYTQQTTSQIGAKDDHIAIVAGDPGAKILLFSDDNTFINVGNDAHISANNDVKIKAGRLVKIMAESGVEIDTGIPNDWQGSKLVCNLENTDINSHVINLTTPSTGNSPNIKISNNKNITIRIGKTGITVENDKITIQTSANGNKITMDKDSLLLQNGNNSKVLLDKDFAKIGAGGSGISVIKDGNIVVTAKQGKEYKMGPIKITKQGKVNIQ
jgi:type VI secretion system VgrG family protein